MNFPRNAWATSYLWNWDCSIDEFTNNSLNLRSEIGFHVFRCIFTPTLILQGPFISWLHRPVPTFPLVGEQFPQPSISMTVTSSLHGNKVNNLSGDGFSTATGGLMAGVGCCFRTWALLIKREGRTRGEAERGNGGRRKGWLIALRYFYLQFHYRWRKQLISNYSFSSLSMHQL